jgi:superfamily II DNA or RNA helicase
MAKKKDTKDNKTKKEENKTIIIQMKPGLGKSYGLNFFIKEYYKKTPRNPIK